jgi:hypothetical protein
MPSPPTQRLVVAATLVQSVLAGTNVNGLVVSLPAWQQTGALPWAAFSRHADLSRRGMVLYPLSAFLGLVLSAAAVLSFRRDRARPRAAALPLYGAVLMDLGGLLVTVKAAPNMLRVRRLGDDEAALQRALDGFQFWSNIRGVFQVLALVANVLSLARLAGSEQAAARGAPHDAEGGRARRPGAGATGSAHPTA